MLTVSALVCWRRVQYSRPDHLPAWSRCQEKWTCMARGDFPQGKHVPGVEPLSTWIPNAVADPSLILSNDERRIKCESLLLGMDDVWQQLLS